MPQPLRKFKQVHVGSGVFAERASLGTLIARIAAQSTAIDVSHGLLMAALLRSEAEPGIAMYLALSGSAPRNAALRAAAEKRLDTTELENFDAIMKVCKKAMGRRNRVVHALWGMTEQHPDALIRVDPSGFAADMAILNKPLLPKELEEAAARSRQNVTAHLEVWKARDFLDVESALAIADGKVRRFTDRVRDRYHEL